VVFIFWHELDAAARQGLDDLVPDSPADVAMPLLCCDVGGAADLEPVDGPSSHVGRLRELKHG